MQSEADDGAVDHFVREWMKQLRELRYDAEDCVDLYKLRIKTQWRGSILLWFKHHFETLLSRRRLAGEISALRARAVAISERHARYGVSRDALRRSPASLSAPPPVLASSSAHVFGRASDPDESHQVVGIDEQIDALVDRLKVEGDDLRVFSIVGFGGLGKTTLALEVCRRLEAEFPWQAMVSVSQAFESGRDLRPLLKRVVEQVVKAKIDTEEEIKEAAAAALDEIDKLDDNKLEGKLGKLLEGKRYKQVQFA